jgi:hypothetical protein
MLDTEIQRPGYTIRLWIDFQGRHRIFLNGQQVADKQVWGAKAEHVFQQAIDGRVINFTVILQALGLTKCRCQILENGTEVHASEHRLFLNPKLRDIFGKWLPKAPRWAWIFIGLCLLIPIVTLGGAVPAVIGFIGAWGCAGLASTRWPIVARVVLCLLVTIASWTGLILALGALNPALGRQ